MMSLDSKEKSASFADAIQRLDTRSQKCRAKALIVMILLYATIVAAILTIVFTVFETEDYRQMIAGSYFAPDSISSAIQRGLEEDVKYIIRSMEDKDDEQRIDGLQLKLDIAFGNLERYEEIKKTATAPNNSESKYANLASRIIYGIGFVAFAIFLIQIGIMFGRYFTRLAELYESQADALRASEGVPSQAFEFMKHFSPNVIDFGRSPGTIYEKALDAITAASARN